jgi:peptide/nickel transport system permease protein
VSAASANLYRASWLSWPARLLCWPLAAAALLVGLLWRTLGALVAFLRFGRHPERGLPAGLASLGAFARGGVAYLGLRTDRLPAFSGARGAEESTPGPWWEAKRRLKKSHVAMASVILFVAYLYVGLGAQAGWVASGWDRQVKGREYVDPGAEGLPLGTDLYGRDVLALTLRGATTALWIGAFAALISCLIGVVLGALAGYFGGRVDDLIVWMYTTMDSIPYLLLLIAFSFAFKNNPDIRSAYDASFLNASWHISLGLFTIILVVGLTSWVGVCRVVRAEFLKHRDRDYVAAARSMGFSHGRIMFKHILPNVFHLVLISYSLLFVTAIKFEVILSFLGLGMEPGAPSWGAMISNGAQELLRAHPVWWLLTAATVALFGLVLAVNLFADALRDALDPRLRN